MPPPPGTKTNVLPPPGIKTNVPLPGIKPNVPPSRDQLPADSESKPPPEEGGLDKNTKKMMKEDGIKNWEKAVDDFKSNLQGWTTSYPTLKDSFIKNIKDNKGEVPAEDVRESVLKAHILLFRCMFERMVAFWRFMPSKKQMKRLETIKDEIQQIDTDNLKEQLKKKRHSVYQEYEKICAHYQEFVKMIQDKYEGKILFFVEDTTESESPDYYMFDAAQSLIALHPLF
uniref:Uncharacterized protein n=1 Tax=Coptotermes formosanus TaxID=36987 RepID=R4UL81_COPFO|nr:hypothetical protein [Coptotermes formosanus]